MMTTVSVPATGSGSSVRAPARSWVDLVLDANSFAALDPGESHERRWPERYHAELEAARAATGLCEAVVTAVGALGGRPVVLIVSEFEFLAGSIGIEVARRVCGAFEYATRRRLPVIALLASGGTRMQEGTSAFLQMIPLTAAVIAHKAAGLPYLAYLRHPTTGGVFASWGSQAHVTLCEPGALIGFLGPRVYEALNDRPFPQGVQVAERLVEQGLVDAVVPAAELRNRLRALLEGMSDPRPIGARLTKQPSLSEVGESAPASPPCVDAWSTVLRTRRPGRPSSHRLLSGSDTRFVSLGQGRTIDGHTGILVGLARFGGASCVVIGHVRGSSHLPRPVRPAGLRQAIRAIELADGLGLPIVTVIDTPGAELSPEAELGGLSQLISACLARLVSVKVPTVSILLGQGTGGGALALLPADRTVAASNAWLAALPPEGASAVLHRTTTRAPEVARAAGVVASRLRDIGAVDQIVEEMPDAADEADEFCERMRRVIGMCLEELATEPCESRLARRHRRFMSLTKVQEPDTAAS